MTIQVGRTLRTITVSGGNLFVMASEIYGDHTLWALIARANGLLDPDLTNSVDPSTGTIELVIPDKPARGQQNIGVIGA